MRAHGTSAHKQVISHLAVADPLGLGAQHAEEALIFSVLYLGSSRWSHAGPAPPGRLP